MSLSQEMGLNVPENHVFLPSEAKRRIFDRDFSIREIKCATCQTVLCALVIAEEHEADCVWPFDTVCQFPNHLLVAKGTDGASHVFCHGRAVQEWEAKKFLENTYES